MKQKTLIGKIKRKGEFLGKPFYSMEAIPDGVIIGMNNEGKITDYIELDKVEEN